PLRGAAPGAKESMRGTRPLVMADQEPGIEDRESSERHKSSGTRTAGVNTPLALERSEGAIAVRELTSPQLAKENGEATDGPDPRPPVPATEGSRALHPQAGTRDPALTSDLGPLSVDRLFARGLAAYQAGEWTHARHFL